MTHKRKLSVVALLLGAIVLGALIGSGCAIQRGDRSIVQPLALDKKQFTGDWYYQKTLTKAPYDAGGSFPGSTDSSYKVRWEITERYLYAFTTQPNVRNADSSVAPVAAWPIIGHFTVRYMINYSTGQPSNVVGEDYRDKPWYQRPHFRVAWGRSVITDFSNYGWLYALFGYSSNMNSAGTNVRPENVRILTDYMDFVSEEIVTPGFGGIIGRLNSGLPATSYRLKYRYSFRKVAPSTYTPRTMSDDQFQKFGYFRTAILKYNVDRGLVDWSYQYLANRHNVATAAEIAAGSNKPKQITYYMSPDFPEKMRPTAELIIAEWNKAFQRATNRTDDVIVLRDNAHGLPKGQKREMGDIRYRFLYWVPDAISYGLLGYGPSFADYDTGEIISSAAYIYGATVQRVVSRFMLLYDMVKGTYSDEDLRNGKDYLDIINKFNPDAKINTNGLDAPLAMAKGHGIMRPTYKGFDLKKAVAYIQGPAFAQVNKKVAGISRASLQGRLSLIDKHPALKWAMIPDEYLQTQFPAVDIPQLKQMDADSGNKILNEFDHPANLLRVQTLRKMKNDDGNFARHNMMLANYVDPAMTKFVEANKDRPRGELEQLMTKMIFLGTQAHEIGHTLGLRHNFEASADEPNYFPKYFELQDRQQGGNSPGTDGHTGHAWFYMYSSIMDYHGETYGDAVGIGSYDHAAIMYAYGNQMELDPKEGAISVDILDDYLGKIAEAAQKDKRYTGILSNIKVTKNKLATTDSQGFDGKAIKLFKTDQLLLHVEGTGADGKQVSIIKLTADDITGHVALANIHALYNIAPSGTRFYADGTPFIQESIVPLRRKFYRFCSDELVGQSPYCARFDSGSNPLQMVKNMIRRYDGNYPLRNWNRGRRYYRLGYGYLRSLIGQFSTVSLFFQNWMFRVINEDGFQGTPEFFDQLSAVQRGVQFVSRVLYTPEPTRHVLDSTTGAYVASAKASNDSFSVPLGVGKYFYSKLQEDEIGLAQYRFQRIGTMWDKYVALMTLAIRDWGLAQNAVNFFLINFADYFSKDDVTDMFTGAISGIFNPKFAYTYKGKMIQPNWHPVLQYQSMYIGMSMLNNGLFGNTFTHYMTVGIQGSGSAWTPPPGREAQTASFQNTAGTRTYFAVQTDDKRSIAHKLVMRGKDLAEKIKELRALPTSAINASLLQDYEGQLVFVESVIMMMKGYVTVFFEG